MNRDTIPPMKKILALLVATFLSAGCLPPAGNPDGLDAETDASVQAEGGEASADALPPHVDGGGMDSSVD